MAARIILSFMLLGATGAIALLGLEHYKTSLLRSDVLALRATSGEVEELELQRDRLQALQVSPQELGALRRDHEDIARLRESLSKLGRKSTIDELFRRAIADTRATAASEVHSREESESLSRNQGNHSPKSTLDSVIWAASAGNVDALAPLITFEPLGRAKAQQIFNGLPAAVRTEYGGPEKIYATLLAANLPLGITQTSVIREPDVDHENATLALRLARRDGSFHDAEFNFRRTGTTWQLIVPTHIVENYGRVLTAP